jgi:hypothetical protein
MNKMDEAEIRLAVCEKSLSEINRRLDHIEKLLCEISKVTNISIGTWKAVFFIGAVLAAILSFIRITN